MRVRWIYAILLALLTSKFAQSDTVLRKDNLSINGSLIGMANGVIKIMARFSSEEKEVWISVGDAQSIEFNSLTFNPGAPPKIPEPEPT